MTTTRSNFPDLFINGLRAVLYLEHETAPREYERIFNIHSSTKKSEVDSAVSGLGLIEVKLEGQKTVYDDPIQRYDKTYTHLTYSRGFRVTHEMYEDDQYSIMKKMPKALARSANYTVEQVCANIFNNAFTSGTGGDGKYLCATDHPRADGGTAIANRPTTHADLSISSLQAAWQRMMMMVDDRGLICPIQPKMIITHPAGRWAAEEILNSNQKPYTADNEINVMKNKGLITFDWAYLTDEDAWFLLADKSNHELHFFWREKMNDKQDTDFDTDDLKFKVNMRFSVGWTDFRGVDGSAGI